MGTYDPPASVLTGKQRQYLRGEHDPANESHFRTRIRERLQASVYDYDLILGSFRVEDIRDAFEAPEGTIDNGDTLDDPAPELKPFSTAMPSLFAVPYIDIYDGERSSQGQPLGWQFEIYLEQGIKRALNRLGMSYEAVDVDVSVEVGDSLDDLAEGDLRDLDSTTLSELHQWGVISAEEFVEAWSAQES